MLRPNPTRTPGSGFLSLGSGQQVQRGGAIGGILQKAENCRLDRFLDRPQIWCVRVHHTVMNLHWLTELRGGGIFQSNNQFYLPGKCYKYFKYRMSTEDKFLFGTN